MFERLCFLYRSSSSCLNEKTLNFACIAHYRCTAISLYFCCGQHGWQDVAAYARSNKIFFDYGQDLMSAENLLLAVLSEQMTTIFIYVLPLRRPEHSEVVPLWYGWVAEQEIKTATLSRLTPYFPSRERQKANVSPYSFSRSCFFCPALRHERSELVPLGEGRGTACGDLSAAK